MQLTTQDAPKAFILTNTAQIYVYFEIQEPANDCICLRNKPVMAILIAVISINFFIT